MTAARVSRAAAIAAADGTCPRCGAARAADQRYCLECGLALPLVTGRLAALRRRWLARVGWYPGDWVWLALVTLLVAAAGAAAAIVVSDRRAEDHTVAFAAPSPGVAVTEPTITAAPTTTRRAGGNTTTLPTPPEPGTPRGAANGRFVWPASENGWTIVLVSYPAVSGHDSAYATATRAAKAGLTQVGVLNSSRFASLQPGYDVVFTGVYGSKNDADAAVATARQAGFAGAYSRQIAR